MDLKMELRKGTLLQGGKYKIEKKLGQGSFGITYLATIQIIGSFSVTQTEIKVAVKEFFMKDINGRNGNSVITSNRDGIFQDYKNRFIKEAKTLNSLKHPNIVHVIDLFEENNTAYYIMDYLEGGSLDSIILEHGPLSPYYSSSIFFQVCDALMYMHEHKMLHLDLKPSNIMLDLNDKAVLIDFGLTKHFNDMGQPESSTTVGAGTPGYAPIEQSNYKPDLTDGFPATIDVYALGATLYKMLSGKRPPNASEILNEGFPKNELLKVPKDLVDIIELAMMPMRKKRIQNIEEFVELYPIIRKEKNEDEEYQISDDLLVTSVKVDDNTLITAVVENKIPEFTREYIIDKHVDKIKISCKSSLVLGSYDLEVRLSNPKVYDRKVLYIYGKNNFDKFVANFNKLHLNKYEVITGNSYNNDGDCIEISCYYNDNLESTSFINENMYGVGGDLGPNFTLLKSKLEGIIPSLERHLRDVPLPSEYNKGNFVKNIESISFMFNFRDTQSPYHTTRIYIVITDSSIKAGTYQRSINKSEYGYFIDNLFEYLQSSRDLRLYRGRSFLHIKPRFGSGVAIFSYAGAPDWNNYSKKHVLENCFSLIPYMTEILNHFNTYPDWGECHYSIYD